MLTLSRILLLRCNYISRSKGLLEECVTNKSIHFIQRLNVSTTAETEYNPLVKHRVNQEDSKPKYYDYSASFKQLLYLVKKSDTDIKKCLPALNRMISIYHNQSPDHKLSFDLKIFLMSNEFKKFCGILHKHLPNFQPDVLVNLLSMEHFGVPVNSTLMQKVLVLILDNINSYTALDKVFIYATISRKYFEKSEQCAVLKKALDVYLETMFDQELDHFKSNAHVIPLMQNENVPVKVKKKIAEKIIRESVSTAKGDYFLQHYLQAIFVQPIPLFSSAETIEILKRAAKIKPHGMISSIVYIYRKLVQMDDSFYNESFCNDMACNDAVLLNRNIQKLAYELCSMGHLNDDLVKSVAERFSASDFVKLGMRNVLPVAGVFARSCAHERNILQPEVWEGLKMEFQSFISKIHSACVPLRFCKYLTFLGCDTRSLFKVIFDAIEEDKYRPPLDEKDCILRFHHLARAYFSNECATLSDKTLLKVLEELAAKNNSFPATLIDFIGGEDYLLKNCTTPEKHFLHYVAVLGPDNKPVNLSSFKKKTTPFPPTKKHLYNIEDIERPPGSKIVAFQNFLDPQPIRFYNAPVVSGAVKIFLKSFESLNCDIVPLPIKTNSNYLESQLSEIIQKRQEKK